MKCRPLNDRTIQWGNSAVIRVIAWRGTAARILSILALTLPAAIERPPQIAGGGRAG